MCFQRLEPLTFLLRMRCFLAIFASIRLSHLGLSMNLPSESASKFSTPTSMPTTFLVGGKGRWRRSSETSRAMPDNLNHADILDIKPQPFPFVGLNLRPISIGEFQCAKTMRFFKPRITNLLSCLDGSEKLPERLVQPTKDMLGGTEVQAGDFLVDLPRFCQFPCLVEIGDGSSLLFPSFLPLSERFVVETASNAKECRQKPFLRPIRLETVLVSQYHRLLSPSLPCDVSFNGLFTDLSDRPDIVGTAPECGKSAAQLGELLPQNSNCVALQAEGDLGRRKVRRPHLHEKMNVVGLNRQFRNLSAEGGNAILQKFLKPTGYCSLQDGTTILRTPNEVIANFTHTTIMHRPTLAEYVRILWHITITKSNYKTCACLTRQRRQREDSFPLSVEADSPLRPTSMG